MPSGIYIRKASTKKALSTATKNSWKTIKFRKKIVTVKRRKSISKAIIEKYKDPTYRAKQKAGTTDFAKNTRTGKELTAAHKNKIRKRLTRPESKRRQSALMIKKLQDPAFKKRVYARSKITFFEQKIIALIKEFKLPYKFVGMGDFWVGRLNPDFISINKSKFIIEVYGVYFKEKQYGCAKKYERNRKRYFLNRGFGTVFLSDKDFKGLAWKDRCLAKIQGGEKNERNL